MAEKLLWRRQIATGTLLSLAGLSLNACASGAPDTEPVHVPESPVFDSRQRQPGPETETPDKLILDLSGLTVPVGSIGDEIRFLSDVCLTDETEMPVQLAEGVHTIDPQVGQQLAEYVQEVIGYETNTIGYSSSPIYNGETADGNLATVQIGYRDNDPDTIYLDMFAEDSSSLAVRDAYALPLDTADHMSFMLKKQDKCIDSKDKWTVWLSNDAGSLLNQSVGPSTEVNNFLTEFDGIELINSEELPYSINQSLPHDPKGIFST